MAAGKVRLNFVAWAAVLVVTGSGGGNAEAQTRANTSSSSGDQFAGLQDVAPSSPVATGLLNALPTVINVALFEDNIYTASISDVLVADLDADGWNDIAVAWYASDASDISNNQRVLTLFHNVDGTEFQPTHINLYIPNYDFVSLSVFRIATGMIGQGDFDGDGDCDLAVTPVGGDELWFIENLGGWQFTSHLKLPFGINSSGNLITPQRLLSADFDHDGRDDLVYIVDPSLYLDGLRLHSWKTFDTIANMQRMYWEGLGGELPTRETRALMIDDFDDDGTMDLCFTGSFEPEQSPDPVLTFWHSFDPGSGFFAVHNEYPTLLYSDLAAIRPTDGSPAGFLGTDNNGQLVEYWQRVGTGDLDFELHAGISGYAGLSFQRGMAITACDLDGDGDTDFVTKQKQGSIEADNQVELTYYAGPVWQRPVGVVPDSTGFRDNPGAGVLRSRNLAVADLMGNRLPEIIGGFFFNELSSGDTTRGVTATLDFAIWQNSSLGDVNLDGRTDGQDIDYLSHRLFKCAGDTGFEPHCDLDRDGCTGMSDLGLVLSDFGANCAECDGLTPGDMNCDGLRNNGDFDGFLAALYGRAIYEANYPGCKWLNADMNGDMTVDNTDIDPFIVVMLR